nr:retrovirus-related Pol polyprotein from transposon TNT 1-94 [Tanacetum cinerariifolium]
MANLSENIQSAGSDTRPPMLDRTDFASWQQRIRLYCWGKENGVNILKSIDEGPYQTRTVRETLTESTEGAPQFGPERPRVYSDLTPEEKDRYNADIQATNILLQGLPKDIYTLINHYTNAKDIWDNVKMLLKGSELTKEDRESQLGKGMNPRGGSTAGYGGAQNRVGNVNPGQGRPGQARPVKCYNCNGSREWSSFGGGAAVADDCDAFDSDVDEALTAQTMFMANLSSADPDVACAHHEEHVTHDSVQLDHVVDSHVNYTSDSNMIMYDQYVKDNEVPVVHSDVSSVPNDAFMMIYNDMCESHAQSVSNPSQNTVVKNSLTAKLATYKEQVELKPLALKAKKESSDEECLTFRSEDEEYAMGVRDFKKFFKRRGRFVRQSQNNKKTFYRSRDDKNGKSDRKCFRCGDPNHLIGECPKPPKGKNQRAFVGGSWSDSGEEDYEKVNNETCLVAQASSEVYSESSYFSDENSSIDDLVLDNEYDKLCKMSLKINTKNKRLKITRNNLEKELSVLKEKVSTLVKNKRVDLECVKCHMLKIENEKIKEEVTRLNKFKKSTQCLNEMLSNQKPFDEKLDLGFNSFEASSSGTKEIKFMKAQKKASSDRGLINMGGPQSA